MRKLWAWEESPNTIPSANRWTRLEAVANSHASQKEFCGDRQCNRKYTADFRPKGGKAKVKLCGKSAHTGTARCWC